MKRRIAVVGAGIFGCHIAMELSKLNVEIYLFEKNSSILSGATSNSQNRIHLGLHYPRDMETALQSIVGFNKFVAKYPESTFRNFNNYYSVANSGSKITFEQFIKFSEEAKIFISEVKTPPERFLHDTEMFGTLYKCNEAILDTKLLQGQLRENLETSQIKLNLGEEVISVESIGDYYSLTTEKSEYSFDLVIRATYNCDSIISRSINLNSEKFEFQNTVIAILNSNEKAFGLTVVDGDYLTVLPYGRTGSFLAYAPTISTINRKVSSKLPKDNDFTINNDVRQANSSLIAARVRSYLPKFKFSETGKYLKSFRTIRLDARATDKRTSHINMIENKFIDIWSGKIDHCIDISEEIFSIVKSELNL